ncbi:unnamed protein product [Mycena citricolor]|uniref:ubiquitinyl hydrolase 1 n=1 Tax=Mycena citricolor TaxID=2018698 RepID=A0AAD2HM46_9AGAR|nr:unnamed protein product [Mycena citricolor]
MVKRKRDGSDTPAAPRRTPTDAHKSSFWGWVGTEVHDTSAITPEHLLATCGLSSVRNRYPFCRNSFVKRGRNRAQSERTPPAKAAPPESGKADDVIVLVSDEDDEVYPCTKKKCKSNPNCLNYLGQRLWEDEDDAEELFMKVAALGEDPSDNQRKKAVPVGLKVYFLSRYVMRREPTNARNRILAPHAMRMPLYKFGSETARFAEVSTPTSPIFQLQVTFAALQASTQSCFNPTSLVESLQLVTTEQQDAQEFSKLFMSHLDAEFKKQSDPALQSLLTDQFQGTQAYSTVCSNCQTISARESDFLELEINFKNNAKLEDSIADLLREESLTDDNKYHCSKCDSLQDAIRRVELRQLPPVLHFSLLRFQYDVSSEERRKSKNTIQFPTNLDMSRFIHGGFKPQQAMYELRGVLLHKGKSAYHGHYEAQVFDEHTKSWFQFNDEDVTKIANLGKATKTVVIDLEAEEGDKKPAATSRVRKRRRIDDSDEESEAERSVSRMVHQMRSLISASRISSKDAYMLIYARKELCTSQEQPSPPEAALDVVEQMNRTHEAKCAAFSQKETELRSRFRETRRQVRDIYRMWTVDGAADKPWVLVSQQALESWLEKAAIKAAVGSEPETISIADVLCTHQLLDHKKAENMKRISLTAFERILDETKCAIERVDDICRTCVEETFRDHLYTATHRANILAFDQTCKFVPGSRGFWTSKAWIKDWRTLHPKMHTEAGDPAPDSSEYASHVRCEHGGLCKDSTNRQLISSSAFELLQKLYPSLQAMSSEMEICAVCEGLENMAVEDQVQIRRLADAEKELLKRVYDDDVIDVQYSRCAYIPEGFLRSWRQWINRPTKCLRPDRIDNSAFFCEHDMLAIDPNCRTDIDGSLVLIMRSEWTDFHERYLGGPLIGVDTTDGRDWESLIPICADCRERRLTNWTSTEITVRRGKDPDVEHNQSTGTRQSRRLRAKDRGVRQKLTVTKSTTVKEIKVQLQHELKIPTICQRLFLGKRELDDNTATLESLRVSAHAVLELEQETEVHEISDSDEAPKRKRRREEGGGFGGTILGRSSPLRASSPARAPSPSQAEPETGKICATCTYSNRVDLSQCEMCENTVFNAS